MRYVISATHKKATSSYYLPSKKHLSMRSANLLYTVTSPIFLLLPSSLNTGWSISVKL